VSCEHAFLAFLDALEIQRSLLRDARGADTDVGPHRAAFEALERAAITEANRLTGDATVPAVVRARVRSFVTATTRASIRSQVRTATTPVPPAAIVPRATTPAMSSTPPLPRAVTSSSRPGLGAVRAATPSAFPGLATVGALASSVSSSGNASPANELIRQRVKEFLVALSGAWVCPSCAVDVARTLHLSRVQSGRAGVVVDVVCAGCGRRSALPASQAKALDGLFGPLIGINGAGFRPESYGFTWDNT
jgi:hypothetical protein